MAAEPRTARRPRETLTMGLAAHRGAERTHAAVAPLVHRDSVDGYRAGELRRLIAVRVAVGAGAVREGATTTAGVDRPDGSVERGDGDRPAAGLGATARTAGVLEDRHRRIGERHAEIAREGERRTARLAAAVLLADGAIGARAVRVRVETNDDGVGADAERVDPGVGTGRRAA